jgi:hypothetical protein
VITDGMMAAAGARVPSRGVSDTAHQRGGMSLREAVRDVCAPKRAGAAAASVATSSHVRVFRTDGRL